MRKFAPLLIILGLAAILFFWYIGIKNGAVRENQAVSKEWGNVETAYQRRNDLIGNLVKTVKGAADFEKSTLEAVINARAKATSTTIDPSNITPEQLQQFQQLQQMQQFTATPSLDHVIVDINSTPQRPQLYHHATAGEEASRRSTAESVLRPRLIHGHHPDLRC